MPKVCTQLPRIASGDRGADAGFFDTHIAISGVGRNQLIWVASEFDVVSVDEIEKCEFVVWENVSTLA